MQVLVDILKQDWPHKWPSFIPDIVGASRTNETLCENSMAILRLLSEEVFDFSKDSLTMVGWLVESMEVGWEVEKLFGYLLGGGGWRLAGCLFVGSVLRVLHWGPCQGGEVLQQVAAHRAAAWQAVAAGSCACLLAAAIGWEC